VLYIRFDPGRTSRVVSCIPGGHATARTHTRRAIARHVAEGYHVPDKRLADRAPWPVRRLGLDPLRRPCQVVIGVTSVGAGDDALKPGGQLRVKPQELRVVSAGTGHIAHLDE
jgi:hypothetical protein